MGYPECCSMPQENYHGKNWDQHQSKIKTQPHGKNLIQHLVDRCIKTIEHINLNYILILLYAHLHVTYCCINFFPSTVDYNTVEFLYAYFIVISIITRSTG